MSLSRITKRVVHVAREVRADGRVVRVVDVAVLDRDVVRRPHDLAHRQLRRRVLAVRLRADPDAPVPAGDLEAVEHDVLGAAHVDDVVLEVLEEVVVGAVGVARQDGRLAEGRADDDRLLGGPDVGDVEHHVVRRDVGAGVEDDRRARRQVLAADDGEPVVGRGEVDLGAGRSGLGGPGEPDQPGERQERRYGETEERSAAVHVVGREEGRERLHERCTGVRPRVVGRANGCDHWDLARCLTASRPRLARDPPARPLVHRAPRARDRARLELRRGGSGSGRDEPRRPSSRRARRDGARGRGEHARGLPRLPRPRPRARPACSGTGRSRRASPRARRTGRPILLTSSSPKCEGVPGRW